MNKIAILCLAATLSILAGCAHKAAPEQTVAAPGVTETLPVHHDLKGEVSH